MRFIAILFSLLAMCVGQATSAAAQAPAAARTAVDATQAQIALIPQAAIVKDEARNKTVAEVMRAALSGHSISHDHAAISPGYSSAAFWFVVPLVNNQAVPLKRVLVLEPSWLDEVSLTLTDAQGGIQTFGGGDTRPFAQRSEPHRLINFALTVPPGTSTLVVRTRTRDPYIVTLSLMEPGVFKDFAAGEALYFGLVYGGLLSLLLFNLMLYLSAREKSYLAYCGLLFVFLVMHATYNGHLFRWLLPGFPEANNWAHPVFIYLYCFAGLNFALNFLDLKAKLPVAYRWVRRLQYGMVLAFVASAVLDGYRATVFSSVLAVVAFTTTAFVLGLLSLRKGNTAATFYLSGSVAGLAGAFITALTVMGILPYSFLTFRVADFGMLIDAVMLSLALSARITQGQRLERLRRFFSPAVADQLLSATSAQLYQPHHREIVVLFLDLRGYTAFTQKHGADEVMRILGEFHAAMGELIAAYEATLERFAGDGMMIFFNDPVEIPDPAIKAARMALQMQERSRELNKIWEQRGYNLALGIGIAQGVATIGAIGFEGRRDYAAIGNVTNLAARLCAKAGAGQILVSSVVAGNFGEAARVQPIGDLVLKGFPEPVKCFEITPQQTPISHLAAC